METVETERDQEWPARRIVTDKGMARNRMWSRMGMGVNVDVISILQKYSISLPSGHVVGLHFLSY